MQFSQSDRERLFKHCKIELGPEEKPCWIWTGAGKGAEESYGAYRFKGKSHLVHRISYLMFRGPIPGNLNIDHLCHNRRCFNPDHLEPVTQQENISRGRGNDNSRKKFCPNGHLFNRSYQTPQGDIKRVCDICHRQRGKKLYWERKRSRE